MYFLPAENGYDSKKKPLGGLGLQGELHQLPVYQRDGLARQALRRTAASQVALENRTGDKTVCRG
jgi:hypothetical protein